MADSKSEKMVEIIIPVGEDGAKERFIAVNNYTAKVQCGKKIKVPWYVAKMLENRDVFAEEVEARRAKLAQSTSAE